MLIRGRRKLGITGGGEEMKEVRGCTEVWEVSVDTCPRTDLQLGTYIMFVW